MKQLHSIVTEHGVVRHLAIATGGGSNRAFWTLCSLKYKEQSIIVVDRKYGIDQTRVCHNCMLARRNKDVDKRIGISRLDRIGGRIDPRLAYL